MPISPRRLVAVLAAAVAVCAAGPAQKVEIMGSLALAYDPALWTVESAGLGRWRARPTEEGEGQPVAIDADYGGPCSQEAMAGRVFTQLGFRGRRRTVVLPSGLTAHIAFGATGCRNATSAPMSACVPHQGHALLFETESMGCRGNPYGDAQADELLNGVRPRF